MAIIKAFKGLRPVKELAHMVAALPYDVMTSQEAREIVKDNPYSFLYVDKAEINLDVTVDIYDEIVYKTAKDRLESMEEKKILIQDEKACLYIYRQTMNGKSQTGLVACVSIDDYMNNVIKKHENTRADKEIDRIKHVNTCNANTGPIFLTYRDNSEINKIIEAYTENDPLYNFIAEDGIGHTAWYIDKDEDIDNLRSLFKEVQYFYIADGHHRAASAVKVGLMRREENPNYTGEEEYNYFLAVIFPKSDLRIMDYNRVVKDLNGLTPEKLIKRIEEKFDVEPLPNWMQYKPEKRHYFGMYLDGNWYKLHAKDKTYDESNPIARLDVSILQDNLLSPILGIKDPRKDERIDFVGGIRGLKELEKRVNRDMKVAFSMYPTSMEELMAVADINEVMPPKSTWFEPKLRSGLFIHKI